VPISTLLLLCLSIVYSGQFVFPVSFWLRCFIHRLISPTHQTCTRLLLNSSVDPAVALLNSSVDPAVALLNSSVNPSIQPQLKTDATSCCQ